MRYLLKTLLKYKFAFVILLVLAAMLGIFFAPQKVFAWNNGGEFAPFNNCTTYNAFGRCLGTGYFTATPETSYGDSPSGGVYPINDGNASVGPYNGPPPNGTGYVDTTTYYGSGNSWAFLQIPGCSPGLSNPGVSDACDGGGAPAGGGSGTYYANDFISQIAFYLDGGGTNSIGAAMIIETMLGRTGFAAAAACGGNAANTTGAGICRAQSDFSAWQTLVTQYQQAGLVDFDMQQNFSYGFLQDSTGLATGCTGSGINTKCNANSDDEYFELPANSYYVNTVTFFSPTDPGKVIYSIDRHCGNIIGPSQGLPSVSSTVPSITATCANGIITGKDSNYGDEESKGDTPVTVTLTTGGANGSGQPESVDIVGVASTQDGDGYWQVTNTGAVYTFGDAEYLGGSPAGVGTSIVGIESDSSGGYWLVSSGGGVYAYGANYYGGSPALATGFGEKIVAIAPTGDAGGYYLISNYGRVWGYGDAAGAQGSGATVVPGADGAQPTLNGQDKPFIVGGAVSYYNGAGTGFWLVGNSGQIYAYANAPYETAPSGVSDIVGMASTKSGAGYWEVGSDGGVFNYGDANFYGSMGGKSLSAPVTGIAATPDSRGYWLAGSDGSSYSFGDAGYHGGINPSTLTATADPDFSFNVASYVNPNGSTNFYLTAVNAAGGTDVYSGNPVVCSATTAISYSCGSMTIPGIVPAGQQFTISASVNYTDIYGSVSGAGGTVQVYIDGSTGPHFSVSGSSSPLSGSTTDTINTVGAYTSSYKFTPNSGSAFNCPGPTFDVVDEPYLDVKGGDTSAGSGFCGLYQPAVGSPSSVYSWNSSLQSSVNYSNAGGDQYGVFANGLINGFASAQGHNNSPTGLSFANTVDTSGTNDYGGGFGAFQPPCIPDYYSYNTPSLETAYSSFPSSSGTYYATGNISIPASTIAQSTSDIIYVKGNVDITGNILYAGGPYSNTTKIPFLEIIVSDGDITIEPGVTNIAGVYIAEPDVAGHNGVIYTCAKYADNNIPSDVGSNCATTLTVNGSLVANTIKPWRTAGNVGTGTSGESVNFSPLIWLNQAPVDTPTSGTTKIKTNSLVNLPPVL